MSQGKEVAVQQGKRISVQQVRDIFEAGDLPMPTAVTYRPDFWDNIYVVNPPGFPPTQINPTYCLSVTSAMELMLILADLEPIGYAAPPLTYTGGPYSISSDVPWLEFNNGAVRNAGQVAQYWVNNNGDPGGHTAESRARQDIAWG